MKLTNKRKKKTLLACLNLFVLYQVNENLTFRNYFVEK